jgi:hypothetical protein
LFGSYSASFRVTDALPAGGDYRQSKRRAAAAQRLAEWAIAKWEQYHRYARDGALPAGQQASGSFNLKDNALAGLIALALGIGILISALRGWPSGIGQMVVGAVILGSGAMLLISALTLSPGQPDITTLAIGVVMLLLSLWGIIGGALTLIGGLRPAKQAEGSDA